MRELKYQLTRSSRCNKLKYKCSTSLFCQYESDVMYPLDLIIEYVLTKVTTMQFQSEKQMASPNNMV